MAKALPGGIWPALITPFAADGSVALDAVEALTDLYARQGLGGLYVGGSTGQWISLTAEERVALVDRVVGAAAGRIPVMVHVGATTTRDAVSLARHAEQVGAAAVSAVAPIYYAHPSDVVFRHYRAIGEATGLPLYVYHLSVTNQLAIRPAEYTERLLDLPNIAGMKITDRDLYPFGLIHAYAGDRLQLYSGADEVMAHAVLSGASGAIGTFYNLWGPVCQRALEAVSAGDVRLGRAFMLKFQTALDAVLSSGSMWSFLRAAIGRKYGIEIGMPREPVASADRPWDDAQVARLIDRVDSALDGA